MYSIVQCSNNIVISSFKVYSDVVCPFLRRAKVAIMFPAAKTRNRPERALQQCLSETYGKRYARHRLCRNCRFPNSNSRFAKLGRVISRF